MGKKKIRAVMTMGVHTPLVFLVLLAFAPAKQDKPRQSLEEVLQGILDKKIPASSPCDRSVLLQRLVRCLRPVEQDPKALEEALSRVKFWIFMAGRVDFYDDFRNLAKDHPSLQPLVFPDQFALRAYDMGIAGVEADVVPSRAVMAVSDENRSVIEHQLSEIRQYAVQAFQDRFTGEFGKAFVEKALNERVESILSAVGRPFNGIYRSLSDQELKGILSNLESVAGSMPISKVDDAGFLDPNKFDVLDSHAEIAMSRRLDDLKDALKPGLEVVNGIWDLNNPQSALLEQQLNQLRDEVCEWKRMAIESHGYLYANLVAAGVIKENEALLAELHKEKKPSKTQAPSASKDPRSPMETRKSSENKGVQPSGWARRWILGGALILAVIALIVVTIRQRAKGASEQACR